LGKKRKLDLQFDENKSEKVNKDEETNEIATLFQGIGILVNGYTKPTAFELKDIMMKYGGRLYNYPNDKVTHIIASNLAHSKRTAMKNKLVVKPEWIIDCVKAKTILKTDAYLIINRNEDQNEINFIQKNPQKSPNKSSKNEKLQKNSTKNDNPTHQMEWFTEYQQFNDRIKSIQLSDMINPNQLAQELEIESIKHLLNDWITLTSTMSGRNKQKIDQEDLQIFTGYLLYLLNTCQDLEKLKLIINISKRYIQKNGSFEWIEAYKHLCSLIQTEFYQKYDAILDLD
jgi:hypothetical protein